VAREAVLPASRTNHNSDTEVSSLKSEKEILIQALKAISDYVLKYRPSSVAKLRAQMSVIREIALSALDEARDVATQPV